MNKNPNCDGAHCLYKIGEVRVLPTGGDSNAILCRACYQNEIRFRVDRNKDLGEKEKFKLPMWENLRVYEN